MDPRLPWRQRQRLAGGVGEAGDRRGRRLAPLGLHLHAADEHHRVTGPDDLGELHLLVVGEVGVGDVLHDDVPGRDLAATLQGVRGTVGGALPHAGAGIPLVGGRYARRRRQAEAGGGGGAGTGRGRAGGEERREDGRRRAGAGLLVERRRVRVQVVGRLLAAAAPQRVLVVLGDLGNARGLDHV